MDSITFRDIYNVLEYGAIIASEPELEVLITWNGSSTFNWWNRVPATTAEWTNVDVLTRYDVTTLDMAERIAKEWINEAVNTCDECGLVHENDFEVRA